MAPSSASDPTLEITVQSTRGSKAFSFPKTAKVAEVITEAREAFGLSASDRYELVIASDPSTVLQPERTLVSYHIGDGAVLTLTWTGSGV